MTQKKVALLIGNAAYSGGAALKNAANDAKDVASKLSKYGFEVTLVTDAGMVEIDHALEEFSAGLMDCEIGLFFFAGHGMQIDGHNYLLALDTKTNNEINAKHSSLSLDRVLDTLDKSPANTKIVILDACRDNPWDRAWKRSESVRGLASVYAPKGTIIGFATSPGQVAYDGTGKNGSYTAALLEHIDEPDLPVETMFKQVRNTIAAETEGKQISWEHTSLSGNFIFNMGLARRIGDYSETSLADNLFVPDASKPSHVVIQGLKTYNFASQNSALERLTAKTIEKMGTNNLFIVGRNIYQAASGGAWVAQRYAEDFVETTATFPKDKRKALLDGMLFEIFFDKSAKLRANIKGAYFDHLFELSKHAELKDSFDFISNALIAAGGAFYVVPGRNHTLAVTVGTKKIADAQHRVESVYVDGANVLRPVDGATDAEPEKRTHSEYEKDSLERVLSAQLLVPKRNLRVTYTPPGASKGELLFPLGYSVRKSALSIDA